MILFLCILHPGTCWESGNRNGDQPGRGSLWPSQTHASLSVPSLCPVAEDIIATTTQKDTISSLSYIIMIQYQYNYIIYCKTGFSNNLGLKMKRHNFVANRKYRKVRCIARDNAQDAPPKVEEKARKKPQVH